MALKTTLPIVLYDLSSNAPGRAISPFVWKVRLALNFKGIPHTTEWVELHEIETIAKAINAEPTSVKPDGETPFYTLPIIRDPNNDDIVVSDSSRILSYLDKRYPDTATLTRVGCETFELVFREALNSKIASLPLRLTIPATGTRYTGQAYECFKSRWQPILGPDLVPNKETDDEDWKKLEEVFAQISKWFRDGQVYVMGDSLSAVDLDLVGYLLWMNRVWGSESKEWTEIMSWDRGRWSNLLVSIEPFMIIS